jgi:hypothetical protein
MRRIRVQTSTIIAAAIAPPAIRAATARPNPSRIKPNRSATVWVRGKFMNERGTQPAGIRNSGKPLIGHRKHGI